MFNLRIATLQDAEITYNWAIDPIIRQFSFSKDKIEWLNHKEWFKSKINSEKCIYFIFESDTLPVGSIRFDIDQNSCGLISYLVVPTFHGRGLGELLLLSGIDKLIERKPNILAVAGIVLKENKSSIRIFEKTGFQIVSADQLSIKYIKNLSGNSWI